MGAPIRNPMNLVRLVGQHVEFYRASDGHRVYDPLVAGILRELDHLEEKNWFTPAHKARLLALVGPGSKKSSSPEKL